MSRILPNETLSAARIAPIGLSGGIVMRWVLAAACVGILANTGRSQPNDIRSRTTQPPMCSAAVSVIAGNACASIGEFKLTREVVDWKRPRDEALAGDAVLQIKTERSDAPQSSEVLVLTPIVVDLPVVTVDLLPLRLPPIAGENAPKLVPEQLPQPRILPSGEAPAAQLVAPSSAVLVEASAPAAATPNYGSRPITVTREPLFGLEFNTDATATRCYFQAEYLIWRLSEYGVPALATTGVGTSTGFIGQPGTIVLFGDGDTNVGTRGGARFSAGIWFDDEGRRGLDAGFFFLGHDGFRFTAGSNQFPRIARPFFSPNVNGERAEDVAVPGVATGGIAITGSSRFWGANVDFRGIIAREDDFTLETFGGLRYLDLAEDLEIDEALLAGPRSTDPVGTRTVVRDRFATRNQFFGGQLGAFAERRWDRWFVNARGSLALGITHQTIDVQGSQVQVRPGAATSFFSGGLLAVVSNIGRANRDEFAVIPELNVNLGYQLSPRLRFSAGYGFLFWGSVLRPGEQIDRVVDVALVPNGPPGVTPTGLFRPSLAFRDSDLWVHGLNLGMEVQW